MKHKNNKIKCKEKCKINDDAYELEMKLEIYCNQEAFKMKIYNIYDFILNNVI